MPYFVVRGFGLVQDYKRRDLKKSWVLSSYEKGVKGVTKGIHGFAEGNERMPGPGERIIAFPHCEERKILSLRGAQRRSNLKKGSLK